MIPNRMSTSPAYGNRAPSTSRSGSLRAREQNKTRTFERTKRLFAPITPQTDDTGMFNQTTNLQRCLLRFIEQRHLRREGSQGNSTHNNNNVNHSIPPRPRLHISIVHRPLPYPRHTRIRVHTHLPASAAAPKRDPLPSLTRPLHATNASRAARPLATPKSLLAVLWALALVASLPAATAASALPSRTAARRSADPAAAALNTAPHPLVKRRRQQRWSREAKARRARRRREACARRAERQERRVLYRFADRAVSARRLEEEEAAESRAQTLKAFATCSRPFYCCCRWFSGKGGRREGDVWVT